jgi:hypothetical protein
MKEKPKMPVSERALYQRINRKLRSDGSLILKASRRPDLEVGKYYVIDTNRNALVLMRVNLEKYARALGVLNGWEALR